MFGFVTLFPALYIPGLNHSVSNHTGISWEWAITFTAAFLFLLGVEAWKLGKRVFFRRISARKVGAAWKDMDIEDRVLSEYLRGQSSRENGGLVKTQQKD